ncbi:MAG: protein phosphatase 2C domain-containing protein [Gemmatimonadaceae bacterium]
MTIAVDSFGITDKGKVRESNDDNFLIVEVRKSVDVQHSSLNPDALGDRFCSGRGRLFVVADGVGSGPEGDRASGDTIEALLQYVSETVECFQSMSGSKDDELLGRLQETVRGVHEALSAYEGLGRQPPATTLTMLLLIWPRAYLVHVGDSRAYVRRRGRVQQLTRDQTLGEYMVSLGAWSEDQAAGSRPGATLTSAVGGPQMDPVIGLIDLEPGDSMMLCTDGLTKHVSDDRIATVLGENSTAEAMSLAMMREALEAGGTDNISIIVVRTMED